jgi:rare lipoprotein A (peptidoglycan hydrolase)
MRPTVAVRELALAGIALLAAVVVLAVGERTKSHATTTPQPEGSYTALAGSSGPGAFGRHTSCGGVLHPDTVGVAHPTLPCGARVFITYKGTTVLAQVVDRGPYETGRQFDLTDALARRLGLRGVQQIHWSYARLG